MIFFRTWIILDIQKLFILDKKLQKKGVVSREEYRAVGTITLMSQNIF